MNWYLAAACLALAYVLFSPILKAAQDAKSTNRSALHIEDSERVTILACTFILQVIAWRGLDWPFRPLPFFFTLIFATFWMLVLRIALVALLAGIFRRGPASKPPTSG